MPLSLERAHKHVTDWSKSLARFPMRAHWPRYVFHSCQLEVALEIIKFGKIVCRNSVGTLICDVANQGALWNNTDSHSYVRLYFRPRNSFHLKTEGVKPIGSPYRGANQMSVPITFAFDFASVLCRDDAGFVPGNFAKSGAHPESTDGHFDQLKFDRIYHDGALNDADKHDILNWRMSEVVVQNELPLSDSTRIMCRTTHEERTLRFLLGGSFDRRIAVEQKGSIFFRRGMFIDEIYWQDGHLYLSFHPAIEHIKEKYELKITCNDQGVLRERTYLTPHGKYCISDLRASKDAIWRIDLERCIVYHSTVPSVSGIIS
jgi:hypothetical protein